MLKVALSAFLVIVALAAAEVRAEGVEPPPVASVVSPGGVNFQTGSFNLTESPDLSIGGSDLDRGLQLVRIYQSGLPSSASTSSFASQGWMHNLHVALTTFQRTSPHGANENFISVSIGNRSIPFRTGSSPTSIGGPATQSGAKLEYSSGVFTFTDRDGSVIVFDGFKVRNWTRPNGIVITYHYSGNMLKGIFSNLGYALLFEGVNKWTKACAVNLKDTYVTANSSCPSGAQTAIYSYSADDLWLTGFTNAKSQTTEYQYNPLSGSSRLTCVKRPGAATCEISNQYATCVLYPGLPSQPPSFHHLDRVISQTSGTGLSYTYSYSNDPYCPRSDPPYHASMTMGGATTTIVTNDVGAMGSITDPLGRTTTFSYPVPPSNWYMESPDPSAIMYPEGNRAEMTYYGGVPKSLRLIAKPGLPSADVFSENGFPSTPCSTPAVCYKPTTFTDPRGAVTNYTYSPVHGGILTEMAPAPTANGARPLKVSTWEQRHAWLKNASGGMTQNASLPVWVLTSETQCQTAAGSSPTATCDPAAQQMVTTYEYGANGTRDSLLVKGVVTTAGGSSLRTCYGYDLSDQKIYETRPNAGLATCS